MNKNNFIIEVICLLMFLINAIFFYHIQFTLSANFASVLIGLSLIELLQMKFIGVFKEINEKLENTAIKYHHLLIKLRLDNMFVIVLSIVIFVLVVSITSLPAIVQFLLVIFFSMTTFTFDNVYRNLEKKLKE